MEEKKGATPAGAEEFLGFLLLPPEHKATSNSDLSVLLSLSPCCLALFAISNRAVILLQRAALGMVRNQPLCMHKGQCNGEEQGAQLMGWFWVLSLPSLKLSPKTLGVSFASALGKILLISRMHEAKEIDKILKPQFLFPRFDLKKVN